MSCIFFNSLRYNHSTITNLTYFTIDCNVVTINILISACKVCIFSKL